jgi:CRISPR-associated protein (TIGR02584 family)
MEKLKHILLCVAGGTPAIITETLWALMDKGERVDEVRVITTITEPGAKFKTGRERILEDLLAEPDGQFHQFCRDFPEFTRDLPLDKKIRFDKDCLYLLTNKEMGVPSPRDDDRIRLTDILDDRDNQRAANQICDIVRELTREEQNARLHASVAGGRKTMGLYLLGAMQLFGRADDAMSHVLVNPAVENRAVDFYYKTPQPKILHDRAGNVLKREDGKDLTTEDGEIYLADIPFIRLREIVQEKFEAGSHSYGEIVKKAQDDLQFVESAFNLRFDVRGRKPKAIVATREVEFSERELFVYVLFAYFRQTQRGEAGFVSLDDITRADLEAVCRLISKARGREMDFATFAGRSARGYLYKFDVPSVLREISDPRERTEPVAREAIRQTLREVLSRIESALDKADIPDEYRISRKGRKLEYIFGLQAAPERLVLP